MGGLWCLLLALCLWQVVEVQGQELFATHPSTMLFGRDYTVNLALAEVKSVDKTVRVALRTWEEDLYEGSSQLVTIKAGSRTLKVNFQIPDEVSHSSGSVYVFAENGDRLLRSYIETLRPASSFVMVQTDKGKYKPGDTVHFRVLNIDSQGMPSKSSMEVEIQDINNKTLWKRTTDATDMDRGLMEGNYTLIKDAAEGEYRIIAHSKPERKAIFFVENYTLQKFKVTLSIDAPLVARNIDGGTPLVGHVEASVEKNEDQSVEDTNTCKSALLVPRRYDRNGYKFEIKYNRYPYGEFVWGNLTLMIGDEEILADEPMLSNWKDLKSAVWEWVKYFLQFEGSSPLNLVLPSSRVPVTEYRLTVRLVAIVAEVITNNKQNASQLLTVLPKPFLAQPMEPIPYYIRSDETYVFKVYLRDAAGGELMDWEQSGMSDNLTYYRLYYEYEIWRTVTNMSMPVDSNPVTVSIYVNESTYLTADLLKVWFVYKDGTENMVTGEKVAVRVSEMKSYSMSILTVDITSQNASYACFKIQPFAVGDTAFYQVAGTAIIYEMMQYSNVDGHCIMLNSDHSPKFQIVGFKLEEYDRYRNGNIEEEILVGRAVGLHTAISNQQVSMSIDPTTVEPGDQVAVTVMTNAGPQTGPSLLALRGIDKSTFLNAHPHDVSLPLLTAIREKDRLFESLEDYPHDKGDLPGVIPFFRPPFIYFTRRSPAIILRETGLAMGRTANLNLNNGLIYYPVLEDAIARGEVAVMYKEEGVLSQDSAEVPALEEDDTRTDFPEVWLWELAMIDDVKVFEKTVPDTITSWVLDAFILNFDTGLEVIPTAEVLVKKDIVMSMDLPYSLIRGEEFTLQILVFNYQSSTANVTVELKGSQQFLVPNNATRSASLMIAGGAQGVLQVPIRATTLGEIKLEATALYDRDNSLADSVERMVLVEAEGRRVQNSIKVDRTLPAGSGSINVNMQESLPSENWIPDSLRAYVLISGDIMGPYWKGLEEAFSMPYGCGEQNLISMAPGLFIGKYLKSIQKLDPETRRRVESALKSGYTRQLTYQHSNGSFSAFGRSDGTGSTWLTAYVLKFFSIIGEEGFVNILDPDELNKAFMFIKSKQNRDGSFIESGKVIHTDMMGGSSSSLPFTAFVTIAVQDYYEYLMSAGDTAKLEEVKAVLRAAATHLRYKNFENLSPYSKTILAYTLARSGIILDEYDYKTRADTLMENYQTDPDMEQPNRRRRDIMPYQNPSSNPLAVERNAYAVLAFTVLAKAFPTRKDSFLAQVKVVIDWLTQRRGPDGKFFSTHDTTVAMQATAEYVIAFPETTSVNFSLRVNPNEELITVNNDNFFLLMQKPVNLTQHPNNQLQMEFSGTNGRASITVLMYYNVNSSTTDSTLQINVNKIVEFNNKSIVKIQLSQKPETVDLSSMVVFTCDMPTGFNPTYVIGQNGKEVSRFEIDGKSVAVYFYTEENFETEFWLEYYKQFDVKNGQAVAMKAFDYYHPDNSQFELIDASFENAIIEIPEPPTTGGSASAINLVLLLFAGFLVCIQRALY